MDLVKVSKRLSYVLRHRPDAVGLELGPQGWVDIDSLLDSLARHGMVVTREDLELVVQTNDKRRFTIEGDSIRANQGHSLDLDLGLEALAPPESLFHGTASRFLDSIFKDGLVKGRRHHVHLSRDADTARAVGARHGKPVVLRVDAMAMSRAGHEFFCSANGVWLTDTVPRDYLSVHD